MDANSLEVNRLKNRVIDGVLTGSDEEQLGHIMWHQESFSSRMSQCKSLGYAFSGRAKKRYRTSWPENGLEEGNYNGNPSQCKRIVKLTSHNQRQKIVGLTTGTVVHS